MSPPPFRSSDPQLGRSKSTDEAVRKKRSFRALFSIFRRPGSRDGPKQQQMSSNSPLSTKSVPADIHRTGLRSTTSSGEPARSSASLSNEITAPFSRAPSDSSTSSTSSIDCPSETSTPMTTPSSSSPSVLIKASEAAEAHSLPLPESTKEAKRRSRGSIESYRQTPSPLSTVTDVQQGPYMTPSPHAQRHSQHLDRRNSFIRMLRRSKSSPDLAMSDDEDDGDIPDVPELPSRPTPPAGRPTSSSGHSTTSLGRKFSRRKSDRPTSMIAEPSDISRQKQEHLLILGADPMGPSYYLYPTSKQEHVSRRQSVQGNQMNQWSVEDYKRRSWSGEPLVYENGGHPQQLNLGGSSRRQRRESNIRGGGGFRGNVAQQVIMEEGSDAGDSGPSRRPSRASQNWGPYELDTEPVRTITVR